MSTSQCLKKYGLPSIGSTIYKIPFAHGWKRILVPSSDNSCNQSCSSKMHIHYVSPENKIIRSNNELITYIKSGEMEFSLTPSNFTFLLVSVSSDSHSEYSTVDSDAENDDTENGTSESTSENSLVKSQNSQPKETIMGRIFESLSDSSGKDNCESTSNPSSPKNHHSIRNGIGESESEEQSNKPNEEDNSVNTPMETEVNSSESVNNDMETAESSCNIDKSGDNEHSNATNNSCSTEKESNESNALQENDQCDSAATNSKKRPNDDQEDVSSNNGSVEESSSSATRQPRRKKLKFSERVRRESATEKVKVSDKVSESGSESSEDPGVKKSVKVSCILNTTQSISEISIVPREDQTEAVNNTNAESNNSESTNQPEQTVDQQNPAPKQNGVHTIDLEDDSAASDKVVPNSDKETPAEAPNIDKNDHSYIRTTDNKSGASSKDVFSERFVEMFDAPLMEELPFSLKSNPCNKFCHLSSRSAIVVCFFCKLVNHINCKKFYTVQHQPCCYMCYNRSPSDLSRLFNLATAVVHVAGSDKQPKVISYKSDSQRFANNSTNSNTIRSNVTSVSSLPITSSVTNNNSPSNLPTASSLMKAKLSSMVTAKQLNNAADKPKMSMTSLNSVISEVLATPSPPVRKPASVNEVPKPVINTTTQQINSMFQEHALLRYCIPATPDKMSNRTGLILRIQDKTFLQLQSTSSLKEIFSLPSCGICINQRPYRVEPCNLGLVNNHFQVLLSDLPPPENGFYNVSIYKSLELCMADINRKEQSATQNTSSRIQQSANKPQLICDNEETAKSSDNQELSHPSYILPIGWMAQGSIDVLDTIFQSLDYLPDLLNCRVVCKAWKRIIDSSILWKNLSVDIGSCDISEKAGKFLQKRNCRRLHLDLRGFCNPSSLTSEILVSMSNDLNFSLKELTMDLSTRTAMPILSIPLSQILDNLKNLELFKLIGAKKGIVFEESAETHEMVAPNLTQMHVEYVDNVSYLFTYPTCSMPKLKTLSIGDCSLVTEVSGPMLENVENLTLYFDSEVNMTSFDWVETLLSKVNSLTLSGMSITENLLTLITKLGSVTSLETLNLSCVINSRLSSDIAYVHEVAEMSLLIPIIPNFLTTFNWMIRFTNFDQSEPVEKCRSIIIDSANVELRKLFPNIRFQVTIAFEKK